MKATRPEPAPAPIRTCLALSDAICPDLNFPHPFWCLPTQANWINDQWHLRIWEKSRQVGATKTDALDSVLKASFAEARFDVWVSSRDEVQSRLYLEDCLDWARILHLAATYEGVVLLDARANVSAHVLQFANGRRIYCLSSNPNALAGKRGHVKLDEFALHQDQRLLYRIAKPVTQWGGTLSIISTHRGIGTLFNELITDIRHKGNPMGWHLFSYSIQQAVAEGIVQRINEKSGRCETDEQFLARTQAECIDEEQWRQEYCCQPADENSALFSYEIISACTEPKLKLMTIAELIQHCRDNPKCSLYAGIDVGRVHDLFVLDVGEQIADVIWDRVRIELHKATFGEMEECIYPILALPQLKRCSFDAKGIGDQLHERAKERFGWKAEGLQITAPLKEELAFALRGAFEDRKLRIVPDDALRADLRALKKEVTAAGNIRIDGQIENSHCDRTWAKAYRQYAAKRRLTLTSRLG
ncbi:MAG TPA: terminase family protein [Candidatus Dormibacteraeota bacterium]|nr:terminase family protein [Candidatus Dormibacteraeota bacterium]